MDILKNRLLSKLSEDELNLSNLKYLGTACRKHYETSSLRSYFRVLNAAITMHYGESKKLLSQLPRKQKTKVEYFKPNEVTAILNAFKNDSYASINRKVNDPHSYYYYYVAFCAYTGCRPEEVIALTWDDINWSDDGKTCYININKAYTYGQLNQHTKTHKSRRLPCSEQLKELVKQIPKRSDKLVFPNRNGHYLRVDSFRNNQWKTVVKGLVSDGLLERYLKPCCLRHSFATNLLRAGVDIATVASFIGDLVSTAMEHYIGSDHESANIPDIYKNIAVPSY